MLHGVCLKCVYYCTTIYSVWYYPIERSHPSILFRLNESEEQFIESGIWPTQNSCLSVTPIFRRELEEKLKISVYIPSFRAGGLVFSPYWVNWSFERKEKLEEWGAFKMPVSLIQATLGKYKRIIYVGHFYCSVCIICKVFFKTLQEGIPRPTMLFHPNINWQCLQIILPLPSVTGLRFCVILVFLSVLICHKAHSCDVDTPHYGEIQSFLFESSGLESRLRDRLSRLRVPVIVLNFPMLMLRWHLNNPNFLPSICNV
jgi:hypothetical protein